MNPNEPQNSFNSGVGGQNPAPFDPNQSQPAGMPAPNGGMPPAPQTWQQPGQPAAPDPLPPQPPVFAQPGAMQNPGTMGTGVSPQPGVLPTPPPIYGQQMQTPGMGMPPPASMPNAKTRRMVMITVLAVAALALLAGGYLAFRALQNNHAKSSTNNAAKKSESSTSAPEINTLASFTLVQPPAEKLDGMTVTTGSTPGETVLTGTADATTNTLCDIFYGVIAQKDLPGTNLGDVVAKGTESLKGSGVTINGPTNIKALVLKNVSSSATYSLPSVSFSYTKSGVTEVADYSISELKDTSHAAVLQVCVGKDTVANLTAKLNSQLVPVAAAIGVKTQ